MQPHQPPVRRLRETVKCAGVLGVPDRGVDLAARLQQRPQLGEGRRHALAVLLPLGDQPLVVPALQQVAGVQASCRPQPPYRVGVVPAGLRESCLEFRDVGREFAR